MSKEFYLIVDTETTATDKVYDFGAIVCDRKGNIVTSCAIILREELETQLFFDPTAKGIWSKQYASAKKIAYEKMLESGARMLASSNAVNRWLEKVNGKYSPMLTAYNLAFDNSKCANSGIDLSIFSRSFCLWHLSAKTYANTKAYRKFALDHHYFGNRTKFGNMTMTTNAEVMAHFVTGNNVDEPHTAKEDAQFFEMPILLSIVNKKGWKKNMHIAYNWKNFQIKDLFHA